MVISVEPMESLRYLPMLAPDGWLVTSTTPYVNIPNYPDLQTVMDAIKAIPNHVALDADQIAAELGQKRSANMVILGAASLFLGIEYQELEKAIANLFRSKGTEVIEANIRALKAGQEFATKYIKNH
jgi:indolepyruvate ferredoxin oxidoreductase beta subunit